MPDSRSFVPTFQTLKRRLVTQGGLSGAAWGLCGALALLLAGVWLDLVWELSAGARVAAIVLATLAGLAFLVSFVVQAVQATRDFALACRLDETAHTGGQVVSGFELQSAGTAVAAAPQLTQGLASLAVSQAVRIAEQVPTALAVPSQATRRAGVTAAVFCASLGLVGLIAPRLTATEWQRFLDPYGDHPPYSRTSFVVEPGDAKVRYGDGLEVVVTTAGPPVDSLELVLRTEVDDRGIYYDEPLPMFAEAHDRWRATVASVTVPGQYFVQARGARSHRFRLGVITVPQIEEVRFRVTPPAYTRDPVYEGPLPRGGLSALAGAAVEVRARSNRPLKAGTIELAVEGRHQSVPMQPVVGDGESREVVGSFAVTHSGAFRVNVTDVLGQDAREPYTGMLNLLKDQVPFVRLAEPAQQSLATPSVVLPVVVAAEDDYGISRLELFRSLNDSRALPMSLPTESPPSRRLEESTQLPLSTYGLQPGDVIKLFARVEDNDPAGAKGAESTVAVIQIVSDEYLQKLVRMREGVDVLLSKYQQAQRRLESLQDEIERLQKQLEKRDAEGALSDEERSQLERLVKRIEEEAEAVREAARHKLPYDLDRELNGELEKLADKMQQAADAAREAAGQPRAGKAAEKLDEILKELGEQRKQLKKDINDPLERLAEVYALLEDQYRFVDLYYRQRDLAERLASLKNHENAESPALKARMRELEIEQSHVRDDLDRLLGDIETHASRLPEDDSRLQKLAESARKFVTDVRASGADRAMSEAEAGLAEFSGLRGHAGAKKAADILEKFISRCQSTGQECEGTCEGLQFGPHEDCLGETLKQLLADAGFDPGAGMGQGSGTGSGNGFSSRRSSMSNMGLYGNLPTRGNPTQSKSGNGRQGPTIGGSYRADADRVTSSRLDPHGLLKASGASEAAVPTRYRSRVEQYFQRIADESGGRTKP